MLSYGGFRGINPCSTFDLIYLGFTSDLANLRKAHRVFAWPTRVEMFRSTTSASGLLDTTTASVARRPFQGTTPATTRPTFHCPCDTPRKMHLTSLQGFTALASVPANTKIRRSARSGLSMIRRVPHWPTGPLANSAATAPDLPRQPRR